MKLSRLKNLTEALAGDLLEQSLGSAWRVHPQVALGAVLHKEGANLSDRCFSMLRGGRYDFLIVNRESQLPMLAIELDGPAHLDEDVAERDAIKDALSVSGGLPVCRLPVEAVDRTDDNTTLIQWLGEQFVERQRTRAVHRRGAKRRLASSSDDVRDALVALHGSANEAQASIEDALWVEHIGIPHAFTAVSAMASRLRNRYGIAPIGMAALLCGSSPPSASPECLWLVLDLKSPRIAAFYVLDLEQVPVIKMNGQRVLDWQEADHSAPRFWAESRLFADRGLELWTERLVQDEDEALAQDAIEADEWDAVRSAMLLHHSPDGLLRDRRLLSELNDRLLTRVVGFRQADVVTNLAVHDALRKVETWARNYLVELV